MYKENTVFSSHNSQMCVFKKLLLLKNIYYIRIYLLSLSQNNKDFNQRAATIFLIIYTLIIERL